MKPTDISNPDHRRGDTKSMHSTQGAHAMPFALAVCRWLAELTTCIVLLLGVSAMALVPGDARPRKKKPSASGSPMTPHHLRPVPAPLQWRRPWWAWQLLSWSMSTLTAPTFWFTGTLLLINARSDHPAFWWSLPAIVAIGNAIATLRTNQRHHRHPFTQFEQLALSHAAISVATGWALFLMVGWISGFLPEFVAPTTNAGRTAFPTMTAILWSGALACGFGILSFAHAGALHASLCFQSASAPIPRTEKP